MKNSYSFSSSILVWVVLLLGFVLFIAFGLTTTSKEATHALNELIESQPHKERKKDWGKEKELTKQTRWNVMKKMWLTKGQNRNVLQIAGSRSDLGVYLYKSETHLIETFYDVQGVLQQDLFFALPDGTELNLIDVGRYRKRNQNSGEEFYVQDHSLLEARQNSKYFQAKKAIYDFHTHVLVLYDVTFWTYTIQGHEIVIRPKEGLESHGTAKSMTLHPSDSDSNMNFYAEDLRMQILGDGGLW